MERLMQNAARGMSEYTKLTVIGPRGCREHLPDDVEVIETSSNLAAFLLSATLLAFSSCVKNQYQLIIGGSGIVAPTLFLISRMFRLKSAVFLHGLDLVVDNAIYSRIFLPCIRRVDLVIANSRNTLQIAKTKGVDEDRIQIVNPGTFLPAQPTGEHIEAFRNKYDIHFEEIIIFVGRMTRRKGLSAFIRECLPRILSSRPSAGLVVVGDNPEDSLNKLGEEDDVLREIEKLPQKDRLRFLGRVDDTDLLACYCAADLQVLPLVKVPGDIEGFGMIAIEAAAAGTPTVAFELGGVADAVSEENGALIPPGDYDLFAKAVIHELPRSRLRSEQCRNHAEQFSWPKYNKRVRDALQLVSPSALGAVDEN
jgi:phosphatidylinositol alpha-1,6-mannosyltransferase